MFRKSAVGTNDSPYKWDRKTGTISQRWTKNSTNLAVLFYFKKGRISFPNSRNHWKLRVFLMQPSYQSRNRSSSRFSQNEALFTEIYGFFFIFKWAFTVWVNDRLHSGCVFSPVGLMSDVTVSFSSCSSTAQQLFVHQTETFSKKPNRCKGHPSKSRTRSQK